MKKLLTLLLLATFFIGCSKDDDNGNEPQTPNINPEVPATESLKGQTFSGYFTTYDDGNAPAYDIIRTYKFTTDKEVIEYATKDTEDGRALAEYKGSYAYTYPNLQLKIVRIGSFEDIHNAIMNDSRNEFHYPKSKNENLIFKKK